MIIILTETRKIKVEVEHGEMWSWMIKVPLDKFPGYFDDRDLDWYESERLGVSVYRMTDEAADALRKRIHRDIEAAEEERIARNRLACPWVSKAEKAKMRAKIEAYDKANPDACIFMRGEFDDYWLTWDAQPLTA